MKNEKGFSLIEVLIAIAVLGIIVVGFLGALGTGTKSAGITDERATAKNLAESQMEYVKNQPFNESSYAPAPLTGEYSGYLVTIDPPEPVPGRNGDIQKITINVYCLDKEMVKLEGFKSR